LRTNEEEPHLPGDHLRLPGDDLLSPQKGFSSEEASLSSNEGSVSSEGTTISSEGTTISSEGTTISSEGTTISSEGPYGSGIVQGPPQTDWTCPFGARKSCICFWASALWKTASCAPLSFASAVSVSGGAGDGFESYWV